MLPSRRGEHFLCEKVINNIVQKSKNKKKELWKIIHKFFIVFCRNMQKILENTFMQRCINLPIYQNVDRNGLSTFS